MHLSTGEVCLQHSAPQVGLAECRTILLARRVRKEEVKIVNTLTQVSQVAAQRAF